MSGSAVTDPHPPLIGMQADATVPGDSIWLSASAGTGKTQVLAARVFRLLLRGTDPSAILALTFTKAGAAEMAGRISRRLAAWVQMDDKLLFRDLRALGEPADPAQRETARTLFAKLLDARGGGLRIQTIHGFCQGLLAGFPLEAGLVPGFRPIEQREEALLARETLAALLLDAEATRPAIVDAIGALSLRLGEGGAEVFLRACARAPAAMAGLPSGMAPFVRAELDLPREDVGAALAAECADDRFDIAGLRAFAAMNATWGTARGLARVEDIATWLAADPPARAAALKDIHRNWSTAKGELLIGKGFAPQTPDYAELAARLHARCAELIGLEARARYADLLAAGLEAGRAYADAYARAKRRAGVADFDDLIRATVALLAQPGMGDWVRHKLDLATEHVLVDEAQDTNPRQWAIIRAIADEFFAGQGASGARRTLFVVGDFKQAIFGFQGTHPLYFQAAETHFTRLAAMAPEDDAGEAMPLHRLSLTHSFRSTRPVLEFVDAALDALPPPGLGLIEDLQAHASRVPGPGSVTLWPPMTEGAEGGGDDDEEGWIDDVTRALAKRIASTVRGWLDPAAPLMLAGGRPLAPQDVMILVKRRGDLAALLVARLYAEGVPVAGVDRLRLNAPLAVQDLLAAIRFALQPDDDLSLAALLVSPLIGWSQDDLLAAAVPRATGLWRHLRAHQSDARLAPLADLLARADFLTPHQLLEHLLSGPLEGRRKLVRRLGQEANDPIDELLAAALDFETRATPSLQAFLDWFDRGEVEITRDAAAPAGAVRVLTAHGAKGLQAPLVILADACIDPTRTPRRLTDWTPDRFDEPIPIFAPSGDERGGPLDAVIAAQAQRELEEHWRLFYVAATRAEQQLVITGALGPRAKGVPPPLSWYSAADRAFAALGLAGEGERVFRGAPPAEDEPARKPRAASTPPPPPAALPDWVRAPAPVEARPPRPLAPSSLGADLVSDPPPAPVLRAAAERGRLMHALFERLPALPLERRARAADQWLAGAGGVGDAALRAALAGDVLAIIGDPRFAALFAPEALAEAPIAAVLADGIVVSGTVDRLLIEPGRVRVIDFKTGRRAPATIDEIAPYHLRQIAAYAAALAVIFPDRAIETALLYTAGPALFPISAELLAAHKPGLGTAEQSYPMRA